MKFNWCILKHAIHSVLNWGWFKSLGITIYIYIFTGEVAVLVFLWPIRSSHNFQKNDHFLKLSGQSDFTEKCIPSYAHQYLFLGTSFLSAILGILHLQVFVVGQVKRFSFYWLVL